MRNKVQRDIDIVKIGYRDYGINYKWSSELYSGFCNNDDGLITIEKKVIHPIFQTEVLLHEILHGIFHMWGINTNMSDENEEALVNTIGLALITVFRDNPTLLPQIQRKLHGS